MAKTKKGSFEDKYKSPILKEKIRDIGMWGMIPSVNYTIDSAAGQRRLKEHDVLFSFIDKYFPGDTYAFEPNMRDGRYVFIPPNVSHQGIGISSSSLSGMLEVGHFWYPGDYTSKSTPIGGGQVYVAMFYSRPDEELARMVQKLYIDEERPHEQFCTFPFLHDIVVTLEGNFMDDKKKAISTIREALAGEAPPLKRNGEGLVLFIERN